MKWNSSNHASSSEPRSKSISHYIIIFIYCIVIIFPIVEYDFNRNYCMDGFWFRNDTNRCILVQRQLTGFTTYEISILKPNTQRVSFILYTMAAAIPNLMRTHFVDEGTILYNIIWQYIIYRYYIMVYYIIYWSIMYAIWFIIHNINYKCII